MENAQVDNREFPRKIEDNHYDLFPGNQGDVGRYYKQGKASFKEGRYDRAILYFTQAINVNANDSRAYNNRGSAYVGKGMCDAAISDFTRAIQINPEYARAYHNRGVAYASIGEYEMAAYDNRKALDLDPIYADAWDKFQDYLACNEGEDGKEAQRARADRRDDERASIETTGEVRGKVSVAAEVDRPAPVNKKSDRTDGKVSGKFEVNKGRDSERAIRKDGDKGSSRGGATTMETLKPVHRYTILFSLLLLMALFAGWQLSDTEYIVPEEGMGYNLGIIGGVMMLLLLLYPLRKTTHFMRNWLPIKYWFWTHMVFGIVGPVIILFHSNFSLGSTNSRVALITTLVVAGSGIVGRYIYTRIHYGLYGREMTLKGLQDDIATSRSSMLFELDYAPTLRERLLGFETKALKPHHGLLHSIWFILATGIKARWTHIALRRGLKRALKVTAKRANWSVKESGRHRTAARKLIASHIKAVIRTSYFGFYERLFALWHIFHFPCFLLLIIVAVVHVLAVHMY